MGAPYIYDISRLRVEHHVFAAYVVCDLCHIEIRLGITWTADEDVRCIRLVELPGV